MVELVTTPTNYQAGDAALVNRGGVPAMINLSPVVSSGDYNDLINTVGGISVKSFGAVGDGVADDTAAIQTGMSHVAANGGALFIPAGTYRTTARLTISNAAMPFAIIGDGRGRTVIERGTDFGASVMQIGDSDNWQVSGLTINANHSVSPNGNHGLVFFDCSNVLVRDVFVRDYRNSGIIGFADTAGTYTNAVIDNCEVDGLDAANNGMLLTDYFQSGFINCRAVNVGKSGSPCYGLQLKNGCQDCYMIGGYTSGAIIGIACGNSDMSGTNTRNLIQGVKVFNCNVGLAYGNAVGNLADGLIIDMNNSGLSAVDMNLNSVGNVVRNVSVFDLASAKSAALFRNGDTDNVVHIATISNSGGLRTVMETVSGALRNHVELDHYVAPTVTPTSSLIGNAGGPTNTFRHAKMERRQLSTIASGAVAILDNLVRFIQLDTEAAAATDDLDTITPGQDLQVVTLGTSNNTRDVVVKNATGNIRLAGGTDFTLGTTTDTITLVYRAAPAVWCEMSRADNP